MSRRIALTVCLSLLILSSFATPPINAEERDVVLSGRLSIIYGDSPSGETYTRYYLIEASGNVAELEFETPPYWYANRDITLRGTTLIDQDLVAAEAYSPTSTIVQDILPQAIGTRSVINILVKYSDHIGPEPHDTQFYDDIINHPSNSISDFFHELSYDKLSIQGDVAGNMWFSLTLPKSFYAPCGWSSQCANLHQILLDSIHLANPYVYLPKTT